MSNVYNWGHYILRLLMGTGPPFYVVIRATRMSSRLQGKGIEVPSFLSYFKTLSIGYDPEDPKYWICFLGVNECCGRIMHQSIPAAPSASPPSPGFCGAFARLVSPGGRAFANFSLPGRRAFANPGAIPELLTSTQFPIRI